MSKKSAKCGLLLTNEEHFVSVEHQSHDFSVCFRANRDYEIMMRMSIPYFRVIGSLVLYAVNHLEPDSPLAASLQQVLYEDFNQFLKLIGKHPDMVRSFKNSPR